MGGLCRRLADVTEQNGKKVKLVSWLITIKLKITVYDSMNHLRVSFSLAPPQVTARALRTRLRISLSSVSLCF